MPVVPGTEEKASETDRTQAEKATHKGADLAACAAPLGDHGRP